MQMTWNNPKVTSHKNVDGGHQGAESGGTLLSKGKLDFKTYVC